jgi:hypothetical protein
MQICEPCCLKRYTVLEHILNTASRYTSKCVGCGKIEVCLDLNPGYLRPKPRQEPEKPAKSAGKRKA